METPTYKLCMQRIILVLQDSAVFLSSTWLMVDGSSEPLELRNFIPLTSSLLSTHLNWDRPYYFFAIVILELGQPFQIIQAKMAPEHGPV